MQPIAEQATGVQVLLAGSSSKGPALRVRFGTTIAVSSAYRRYQPAQAYNGSKLTALQGPTVPTACWEARRTFLAPTTAAWSPTAVIPGSSSSDKSEQQQQRVTLLAVGCKAGCCQIWSHTLPQRYGSSGSTDSGSSGSSDSGSGGGHEVTAPEYVGSVAVARGAYVTSLAWAALPATAEGCSSSKGWGVVPGYVVQPDAGDVMVLAVGEL